MSEKHIHVDGLILWCDDSGGGDLVDLPREEAVRLFRKFLNQRREDRMKEREAKRIEAAARRARRSFQLVKDAEDA